MKNYIYLLTAFLLGVTMLTATKTYQSDLTPTAVVQSVAETPPGYIAPVVEFQSVIAPAVVTAGQPLLFTEFIGLQTVTATTSDRKAPVPGNQPERCCSRMNAILSNYDYLTAINRLASITEIPGYARNQRC